MLITNDEERATLADQTQQIDPDEKPPLDYVTLRDVIDLTLWAGQLLLQYGAETQQVEETIHRMGTGLGCNWLDILVSPNAIIITAISGIEFRTKVRRVVALGVNMSVTSRINELSRAVVAGQLTREQLRAELRHISDHPYHYNRWLTVVMVALACGAFSQLFGGDAGVFAITALASGTAMAVRQQMQRAYFNAFLTVLTTALVAGIVASLGPRLGIGNQPQLALASSVLLLVPGVPLINAAEDLIKGHFVTGIVRGITGGLVALCIALGLLLAMLFMGVQGIL